MNATIIAQPVATSLDTNGNPRRGWLVYHEDSRDGFFVKEDSGNARTDVARAIGRDVPKLVVMWHTVSILQTEYYHLCKQAEVTLWDGRAQ